MSQPSRLKAFCCPGYVLNAQAFWYEFLKKFTKPRTFDKTKAGPILESKGMRAIFSEKGQKESKKRQNI